MKDLDTNAEKKSDNSFDIQEIIKTLTFIDDKIISLHECSSEDFLMLNNQMKKYYKNAKTISDNTEIILKLIDSKTCFDELNRIYKHLNSSASFFEENIENSFGILEKMLINLNLIFVPLNNFKQNFNTFRLLHSTLLSSEDKEEATIFLQKQVENFVQIKKSITEVEIELSKMLEETRQAIYNLRSIKRIKNLKENILEKIKSSIKFISEKHKEALNLRSTIKQTTDNYTESINKIITNLQYHDIIRQKMEHIQKAHKNIITEFADIERLNNGKIDEQFKSEITNKIQDISRIQIAQLLQTNRDYQTAIEVIMQSYFEISDSITQISQIGDRLAYTTYPPNKTVFKDAEKKLEETVLVLHKFIDATTFFSNQIAPFDRITKNISTQLKRLFDIGNKIENSTKTIFKENTRSKSSKLVLEQYVCLFRDLQKNLKSIKLIQSKNQEQEVKLNSISNVGERNIFQLQNLKNIQNTVPLLLKELSENNKQLYTKVKETQNISDETLNEIKDTVRKVQYYNFFDKKIEEIIIELNNINTKFIVKDSNKSNTSKVENLKIMEELYTTSSERYIHQQVTENSDNIDFFNTENTDIEDNIELF